MQNIEVLSDRPYFEPNTVKIIVHRGTHQGKFWNHTHPFFEFVYVLDGFSLHSHNGATSILTSGDLFAIYPGNVHSYTAAYNTNIFNILFYIDELGEMSKDVMKLPGIEWNPEKSKNAPLPIVNVELGERHAIVDLLRTMINERQEKKLGWELKLKSMLVSFLVTYSRLISDESRGDSSECDRRGYCGYIYAALKYIEDNYMRDISTIDIAKAAGLSPDYLTKQFKSVMSMTPVEYVRKFRIAKSMNLLRDTEMPIADIAAAAGFGDSGIFSRVFKQTTGDTPTSFRRE
ncbi:MAG: helix-turn-helix domain-containing protein [Clostridia bacterium]|nr:helix-turn-helix domain-containing protein [Clostridia bacterium]